MTQIEIKIKKLDKDAVIPTYGTMYSAGADLYALANEPVVIKPGETVLIHTGLAFEICDGYGGFVFARSGLATKKGLAPANKVGVIDSDYRGEILVGVYNFTNEPCIVENGERIAQLLVSRVSALPVLECAELEDTSRGAGGFGSTGRAAIGKEETE